MDINSIVSVYFLLTCYFGNFISGKIIFTDEKHRIESAADLNIGIFLPLHQTLKDDRCSDYVNEWGLLAALQIYYATKLINENFSILPNITLGYRILDTCGQLNGPVSRLIEFLPERCQVNNKSKVVGIIGPESSSSSVPVAALSSQFELPLVATFATSEELSDKVRFKYFSRLVPPDSIVTEAISQLLDDSNWSYINLLYSEGPYGENAAKSIEKNTKKRGICIGFKYRFSSDMSDEYTYVARKVLENRKAKAIVIIAFGPHIEKFISTLSQQNSSEKFTFIGIDSFSPIPGYEDYFRGSIQFFYKLGINSKFQSYVNALKPTFSEKYWFKKIWEKSGNCTFATTCQKFSSFSETGSSFSRTNYIIATKYADGVELYARALDNLIKFECPSAFENKTILKVIDHFFRFN